MSAPVGTKGPGLSTRRHVPRHHRGATVHRESWMGVPGVDVQPARRRRTGRRLLAVAAGLLPVFAALTVAAGAQATTSARATTARAITARATIARAITIAARPAVT